jgi:hypothetical protein
LDWRLVFTARVVGVFALARDQQDEMSKVRVVIEFKTQGRGFRKDFPAIVDVKRVG